MQFGRIHGIALIVLGIILIGVQLNFMMASTNKNEVAPAAPSTVSEPPRDTHPFSALPGILGIGSLLAGVLVFATARRRDEPDPEHRVR
jgi:hypothetical protein